MYIIVENKEPIDSNQRGSREGNTGGVVGSLHEEAKDCSRMNHDKSNREGDGEKRTGQGRAARQI
jgi:hypothetical protein